MTSSQDLVECEEPDEDVGESDHSDYWPEDAVESWNTTRIELKCVKTTRHVHERLTGRGRLVQLHLAVCRDAEE